jgi:type VI secretion system protein ImpH
MEFPASTLEGAAIDASGRMRLIARFLGMFGPQGALPLTTTEESYHWLLERDDAFPRFVDIFQRRFLSLFFRAWADPRPIAQNDRPADDRFRTYVGSMIGVGSPPYRNVDAISDFAKMEFAGLLAPKAKSASRLRSLIAGLFGVKVEIDEFVGNWLSFDSQECTQLGANQSRLGSDCILGSSIFSVIDKIRIRVFVKDIAQYERFLPGSDLARQIGDAVFLYLGEEYDWDMELAIPAGEITPVRLGQGAKLGWTGWMAPNWSRTDQTIRTDARFHVVSRMTHDRQEAAKH